MDAESNTIPLKRRSTLPLTRFWRLLLTRKRKGVCPLCGHSKEVPYSHRRAVLFGLLLACLLVSIVVGIGVQRSRRTDRAALAEEAVARMGTNAEVVRLIGKPITIEPGLQGEIKQDETGWKQAHLTIPVQGPNGDATAHGVGGRGTGPLGLSRHSRRALARCGGYALLNASNIAMLTGECRSY